jgi:uroporphyrinogen-III synthase
VTFTSPSTFTGFQESCGAELAEKILHTAVIACIGPTTTQAVQAAGFKVHLTPAVHTAAGLIEIIAHHFGLTD